jgi:hypothetical protein
MLEALIHITGPLFLAACALEFLAVGAEQAGAPRSPEEDGPRRALPALAMLALSTLTPGLLLAHGFLATAGADPMLRVWAMAAPVAAMIGGALAGGAAGLARGLAPAMRAASVWLGLAALVVAVFATRASIETLLGAAQGIPIQLPLRP